MNGARRTRGGWTASAWLALAALAIVDLLPLGYTVALSVAPEEAARWGAAWSRLFDSAARFGRWFFNSAAVACLTVGFHLIADAMAAYALAKRRFLGRALVLALVIGAMMVPRQVTLIPLFLGMSRLGLDDTFLGLILPGFGDAIGVFLLRQYFLSIPDALIESARIDGASHWGVFRHVMLPLSRPALAVLAVLSFQHYWSDFFWPLVIAHDESRFTIQVGLAYLARSEFGTDYALMAAGACAAAAPALVVFLLLRRVFFEGARAGAVK
jgi:ABC-type glycerol-3-phosphate transport system permease component